MSATLKNRATEAALIVGSILLAFAIDSRWEAFQERELVSRQLQALVSEVKRNAIGVPRFNEGITNHVEVLQLLFTLFDNPENYDKETARKSFQSTGPLDNYDPRRVAIEELVVSGTYQLIENYDVKYAIATYRRALDNLISEERNYRTFNDEFYLRMLVDEAHMFRFSGSVLDRFNIDLPESSIPEDYETLIGNKKFSNVLFMEIALSLRVRGALEFLEGASNDLVLLIEENYGLFPEQQEL